MGNRVGRVKRLEVSMKKVLLFVILLFLNLEVSNSQDLRLTSDQLKGSCKVMDFEGNEIDSVELKEIEGSPEGKLLEIPPFHPKYHFRVLVHDNHGRALSMIIYNKLSSVSDLRIEDFLHGESLRGWVPTSSGGEIHCEVVLKSKPLQISRIVPLSL